MRRLRYWLGLDAALPVELSRVLRRSRCFALGQLGTAVPGSASVRRFAYCLTRFHAALLKTL